MSNRIWLGVVFLIFGIGLFMHQMNVIDFFRVLSVWWPLILIIIGIIQLVQRNHSATVSGFFFLIIGGAFLLNDFVHINLMVYIWPVLLIFIGIVIIFTRIKSDQTIDTNENVNTFSLFSGTEIRSQSENFQGGSITSVFSGSEVDLRDAVFLEEGVTLELTAIFGGISLTVPEYVLLEFSGIPIFGGWEDHTRRRSDDKDDFITIKLNCLIFCGGVEIKN